MPKDQLLKNLRGNNMNNAIINLLEAIKCQNQVDIFEFLSKNDLERIRNWYARFSSNSISNEKLIDFIYYLYIHENIEMYTVEHFQKTLEYLSETYSFDKSHFFDLLSSYKKMVFGSDDYNNELQNITNKNKLVIVINGKAEVGKDTLCDFIIKHYKARKISAITPILKIAYENGWDGKKDTKSRKFLSDLKRTFIDFSDLPNNYLVEEQRIFLQSDDDVLFVHIRESDQIEAFLNCIKNTCTVSTLLVNRGKSRKHVFYGNDSDDYVDNYRYDYYYNNDFPFQEAEQGFLAYFEKILIDKELDKQIRRQAE